MPFLVQASSDGQTLAVMTATAKEAFAKALEWHDSVSINDSTKSYSIDAFALAMALLDIAKTVNSASEETNEVRR